VFVTSDLPDVGSSSDGVKSILGPGQQIRITPGQFAFLLSQETVEVPDTALAFISMKATYKLRGLINVSGFHVDPGWKAPLLFSVYNAGPSPVVLSQGMELFLIWYADLDSATKKKYIGKGKAIDGDLISNMSGQVFSPIELKRNVERLSEKVSGTKDGLVELKAGLSSFKWIAGIAVTLAISVTAYLFQQQRELELQLAVHKAKSEARIGGEQETPHVAIESAGRLEKDAKDSKKKEALRKDEAKERDKSKSSKQ